MKPYTGALGRAGVLRSDISPETGEVHEAVLVFADLVVHSSLCPQETDTRLCCSGEAAILNH